MNWGALRAGAKGLGLGMFRNPIGRSALAGAALGGIYGGFSDNTSVLGGMTKGAIGGAALSIGVGTAGRAIAAGSIARRAGMGFGGTMRAMGNASKSYIGGTFNRAYNPIKSTLKATFGG